MKRLREEPTTLFTLSFAPLLLSNFIGEWKYLIATSTKIYNMYYKIFVQKAKWSRCVPFKARDYVVNGIVDSCFGIQLDSCRLTHLTCCSHEFVVKSYSSLLTSLELLGSICDYSALSNCTQLIECTIHLQREWKSLVIPHNVKRLRIKTERGTGLLNVFPPNLTHLWWDSDQQLNLDTLPPTLTFLETKDVSRNEQLPMQLLHFRCAPFVLSEYTLLLLPPKLTHLEFCYDYRTNHLHRIDFFTFFPTTLTSLSMNGFFHMGIYLPPHLTELSLGNSFNEPISVFPNGLKRLCFGETFNQPIDTLPNQLQELTLGIYFQQHLNHLPNGLTKLVLNCENYPTENILSLPDNIQDMKITSQTVWNKIKKWPTNLNRLDLRHNSIVDWFSSYISLNLPKVLVIVENCAHYDGTNVRCRICLHYERNCFLSTISSNLD